MNLKEFVILHKNKIDTKIILDSDIINNNGFTINYYIIKIYINFSYFLIIQIFSIIFIILLKIIII